MASKSNPETRKNLQKCCTLVVFSVFAIFGKIASKMQKKSPRCSQKCAKLAILGSKLAILGTSWRQVGQLSAILAPTWAILAPRWAPRGMQKGVRKRLEMKFDTRWKWPRLPRSGHFQKAPKKLPKWSRNLIKNDLKIVPKTCPKMLSNWSKNGLK